MSAEIVFEKMLVLLLMVFVGCFVYKIGMVSRETSRQISGLLVKILNPCILLSSAMSGGGSVGGEQLVLVIILTVLMYVLFILLSIPLAAVFGKTREEKLMYKMMTIFSNVAFIGIPVVKALYGDVAVIYATVFNLGYSCCFYTYGMALVHQAAGDGQGKLSLKSLWNPGVVACLLTLVLTVTKLKVPFFISGPVEYLGEASVPLALITVGVTLAHNDWKEIFLDWKIYVFSVLKLVLIPGIAILLMALFKMDPIVKTVTAVMIAMPVGNMAVIGPESVGMDTSICARGVMITTLLTLITVPLIAAML